MATLSRRQILAGLLASVPVCALAQGAGFESLLEDSGLASMTGFALVDVATGQVVEGFQQDKLLPPASVTKLFTALYALDVLGPDFVFETRLVATGPVSNGRLQGDLVLVGSGDPHLDTDQLADMVKTLRDQGIKVIDGRFLVVGTALPPLHEIDIGQPDFVGYNPSISGTNLNFNRVYFEWKHGTKGLDLSLQARADGHSPDVRSVHIKAVDRQGPVFAYASNQAEDYWTVAAPALAQPGGRWLPVRNPEAYVAEVFRAVAAQYGLDIPVGEIAGRAPGGTIIASHRSIPLTKLVRSMLLFSTNLTAEVLGLTATQALGVRVRSLKESGATMSEWARRHLALQRGVFINHSGLSDKCLVSAEEMAKALAVSGAYGALKGLMKVTGVEGSRAVIQAKTGTLNFCKALAGYIDSPSGRRLAFAIFSTNLTKRADFYGDEDERPAGSKTFSGKARQLELAMLKRWVEVYV